MSGDGQGSGTHDQDAGAAIAAILAGYGESFCVIGADWRITAINHPTETFSGLDAHQIIGSSYWDVAPAAVATAQGDLLRRAMAERSFLQADVPSARQPGRILAMRMFPLGDGLGLIFSDVTEQREQSRREHEQAMRLELALAASGMGDWSWDAVTDVVTLSPRAAEVYRAPCTTMTWAEMRALLHPDDAPWVRREARASVAEHRRYDAEYRLAPTPDLPEVWVLIRGAPQYADDGVPSGMLGVIADITATKAREALVRESEARFRAMADSAPAPVWVTSAEGPIEFVNNAFAEFAGQPREALLGDAWIRQMHPDDVAAAVAHREAARKSDPPRAYWMEARFKHASGQWRWIRASSEPRFDDAGVFQGYVGLAIDMTEIRASEGRQRLLINELNHRVKNTLATVQSLAEQTSRMSQSKDEFKDRFLARLMALSAAHTRLTASSWNWTGLAGLVRDQLTLHGGGSENLSAEGPEVEVPPRAALSLSLALHELATNAVKYGALTAPGGQVLVRWDVVRDSDGRPSSLIMDWIERGGPPVVPPAVKGFGSRLLRLVGRDLEGEVDYQFAPEGVHWRVSFPLPARGEDDAVDLGPIL